MINNMMGVGIPLLPNMFQQAGFVTPLVSILLVAVFSGLAATMLAEAMKYVRGNKHYDDRVEYATLTKFYLGNVPYWIVQILLNLSLLSVNLVSILLTVQVMDWTIVRIFGCSCGLILEPHPGFTCVCPATGMCSHSNSPFGDVMVISVGFVVVICMIIPLGYFNLEDNMIVQVICTGIQTLLLFEWVVTFFVRGLHAEALPAFAPGKGQAPVLGQTMLNYAFIMTVPSWCNEKRRSSNVNKVIWSSVGISTFFFLATAFLGALSFPGLQGSDILTAIDRSSDGSIFSQISVYLFPLIAVASSIPVFSIIVRYNLIENGICGPRLANVFAVVLPWVLAVPLSAGNTVFNDVSNYTSIAFLIPINLLIPFIIYIFAMRRKAYLKPCLCEPGPCEHDFPRTPPAFVGDDETASLLDPSSPSLRQSLNSEEHVLSHKDARDEVSHVYTVPHVPWEKWSKKNPKCARCCCAGYVRWKDSRGTNPAARFSKRFPRLAKMLPACLVAIFGNEPPAPEHFALPDTWSLLSRQGIAFAIFFLCTVLLLVSAGLSVWEAIDELVHPINVTGC